ncbi:MAG: fumarylacetoacetate hydrolase family protein, partial [Syntrophomonadaceae bacterium]|nr:fumarylacetoacetate hydrolase family protein [Syntrophomonadaceae bacterium]
YQGNEQIGICQTDQVVSLTELLNSPIDSMLDLISSFQPEWLNIMDERLKSGEYRTIPVSSVKLLAPIPYPRRNVFCLGKNYVEHAQEIKLTGITDTSIPQHPIYFTKVASPAIGQNDPILVSRQVTTQVDYEVELAIVIGRDGINIKPEEAEEYIFGYTIANDVSARNLQANHLQWFKGKSLNNFCPLGPVLVHKSAFPLPLHLEIQCRINGELRQNSNTKNMIFDIPHIISDLSKGMTLKAGDIICTGTPSGVGMGFEPPRYLADGDVMECYIEKIGKLTNQIIFME